MLDIIGIAKQLMVNSQYFDNFRVFNQLEKISQYKRIKVE